MILKILKIPLNLIKYLFIGLITIVSIIPKYFIIGIQCILDKNKRRNINFEHSLISITITTLSLITYLISIFLLTRWYVQNERIKKFSESLNEQTIMITKEESENPSTEENTENYQEIKNNTDSNYQANLSFLNINFNYYLKNNSETVAWIQLNGTKINYPVVKHSDNDYYLNHDFYQKSSSTGWIFADYRNDFENLSNNTIIYGHNLINKTMLGSLTWTLNKSWYNNENNRYIKLSTPKYNSLWQIFSIYKIEPTIDYLKTKFNSTENYQDFLNTIKNRSIYNFNVNLTFEDKILTLSTCDDTGTKRVVVHAKLYSIENN